MPHIGQRLMGRRSQTGISNPTDAVGGSDRPDGDSPLLTGHSGVQEVPLRPSEDCPATDIQVRSGADRPSANSREALMPETTRRPARTFDPVVVGQLECDAWAAYYRREWV